MLRIWMAIGIGIAALSMVIGGLAANDFSSWPDTLGNLGAELIGIALTVAIVDWLIERKRLREQSQQFAWRLLHDMDHALWVWQGGRREFHLDEMVSLLRLAQSSDPFPATTQDLFINLGVRASDMIRLHTRLMTFDKRLKKACSALGSLSQLRESRGSLDTAYVIDAVRQGVSQLAAVTGQTVHEGEFGVARAFRDPTLRAQEQRYRGTMADQPGRGMLGDFASEQQRRSAGEDSDD